MSVKGPQLALYDTAGGGAGLGGLGGLGAGGLGCGTGGLGGGGLGDGGGGFGGGGDMGLMAVTMGRPLFCMYTMNALSGLEAVAMTSFCLTAAAPIGFKKTICALSAELSGSTSRTRSCIRR